jgi:exosome complex protein LRP1
LNGVKAREHAVFKELTRVKQYFDKIKTAETPAAGRPTATLDKKAAARFIKASLVQALLLLSEKIGC